MKSYMHIKDKYTLSLDNVCQLSDVKTETEEKVFTSDYYIRFKRIRELNALYTCGTHTPFLLIRNLACLQTP